jgi:hypothetical protein
MTYCIRFLLVPDGRKVRRTGHHESDRSTPGNPVHLVSQVAIVSTPIWMVGQPLSTGGVPVVWAEDSNPGRYSAQMPQASRTGHCGWVRIRTELTC